MMLASLAAFNMEQQKLLFDQYHSESLTSLEIGWKKKLDTFKAWKDDMKCSVHARRTHTKNDIFRCEVIFRGHSLERVVKFFQNPPLDKLPMMVSFEKHDLVEGDGKEQYVRYQRTCSPMITDRDTVSYFATDSHRGAKFVAA